MEQSFRFLKRDRRKKSGQHSLNKALIGMLADIDAEEVLKEEQENKALFGQYPRNLRRLFKVEIYLKY
jgi:hypothetical protein